MICHNCTSENSGSAKICQKCGASLGAPTKTAFRMTGELAALDPAVDAAIKPALAARLQAWSVSSTDARLAIHLMGRNYPLARLTHLRELLNEGLIRPETPVLHQKRGRWYEASRFPGMGDSPFDPENTQQFDEMTPGIGEPEVKASTVEGRAVLAARLGRDAEEAASAGDVARAISIYEEVVQINPRYPLVKRRLRQLRAALEEGESKPLSSSAKPASLPKRKASDPGQHDERTTALSLNDLVDIPSRLPGRPPPPPPPSARPPLPPRPSARPPLPPPPPTGPVATPGMLRRQAALATPPVPAASSSMARAHLTPLPPSQAAGARPIDPNERAESTAQEQALEATISLDFEEPRAALESEESTAQELVFEDTPVENESSTDEFDLHLDELVDQDELLDHTLDANFRVDLYLMPEEADTSLEAISASGLMKGDFPPVDDGLAPAMLNSVELGIQGTLDALLSSVDVPAIPKRIVEHFRYVCAVEGVDWDEVAALYEAHGGPEVVSRGAVALKRAFMASQSICLLYAEDVLIAALRAVSDGVALATLCDLVLAPHLPTSLVATALVGAVLQDLDVPTVLLMADPVYAEALAMFDFISLPHMMVRRGATF